MADPISPEEQGAAFHVLGHIGDPRGREAGSFTSKLLDAWSRADLDNEARLRRAFPELGTAVFLAKTQGADAVARWAGLE